MGNTARIHILRVPLVHSLINHFRKKTKQTNKRVPSKGDLDRNALLVHHGHALVLVAREDRAGEHGGDGDGARDVGAGGHRIGLRLDELDDQLGLGGSVLTVKGLRGVRGVRGASDSTGIRGGWRGWGQQGAGGVRA